MGFRPAKPFVVSICRDILIGIWFHISVDVASHVSHGVDLDRSMIA